MGDVSDATCQVRYTSPSARYGTHISICQVHRTAHVSQIHVLSVVGMYRGSMYTGSWSFLHCFLPLIRPACVVPPRSISLFPGIPQTLNAQSSALSNSHKEYWSTHTQPERPLTQGPHLPTWPDHCVSPGCTLQVKSVQERCTEHTVISTAAHTRTLKYTHAHTHRRTHSSPTANTNQPSPAFFWGWTAVYGSSVNG